MKLVSIQVGKPKTLGTINASDPMQKQWTTGFYKEDISGNVFAGRLGLEGDGQADLKNHGGIDKAICCYSKDHFSFWHTDLGFELPHGAFGENFTITQALENDVCIGDIYKIGSALLQISQPRQPCWKLARRWSVKDLAARVEKTGKTGWYFRVLEEGCVEAPGDFVLVNRLHPEWTVCKANEMLRIRKTNPQSAQLLAQCSSLSESLKRSLLSHIISK
jgi:MOSC domain-containing protein YiiM